MSPMEWGIQPLKKYAEFSGRSPRAEYWWFTLLFFIVLMVGMLLMAVSLEDDGSSGPLGVAAIVVLVLFFLGAIIPGLAVQVRRMHDQDMSGWWVLLFLIPYLGGVIALIFMLIRGTSGPNRFGPDPYEDHTLSNY